MSQPDDWELVLNRALQMVAAAARAPEAQQERALRNAKSMIDKAAQRRYTVRANQAQAPPPDAPPKPNRAASSRPPLLVKRGKTNESR